MRFPNSPLRRRRLFGITGVPLQNEALESRVLLAAGIKPSRPQAPVDSRGGGDLSVTLGSYHTYTTATTDLQSFASTYPNITRLISLGKTVQNRDIWAMEITDNPGVNEDEPEMFYEGSMHGDEPVGMEMTFYFINHLLTN